MDSGKGAPAFYMLPPTCIASARPSAIWMAVPQNLEET
jgi:hypothetical protein